MCGKDAPSLPNVPTAIGSPPHVREGLSEQEHNYCNARITPACAGRTFIKMVTELNEQDHPRMCGKDFGMQFFKNQMLGSPPHVREGPFYIINIIGFNRITPACAGRTLKDPVFCNVLF